MSLVNISTSHSQDLVYCSGEKMIIALRHQPNIIMFVQKLLSGINVFVMEHLQDGSSGTWSLHLPAN